MIASKIYRTGLLLLPAGFRARYGRQMLEMFDDEWNDSAGFARVTLALRSIRGLLWSALMVRITGEHDGSGAVEHGRGGWFTGAVGDLKAALRGLTHRPGFAATAVLTSALGIGAMVSVFR
jgi:hypothetical protein